MRYRGQGYELRVELPDGPIDESFVDAARNAFEEVYRAHYGYVDKSARIEGIDWHLMAVMTQEKPVTIGRTAGETAAETPAVQERRKAYFPEAGGFVDARVIDRYTMQPGQRFTGPAMIEERESTTIVLPGDVAHVTRTGHLMVEINAENAK